MTRSLVEPFILYYKPKGVDTMDFNSSYLLLAISFIILKLVILKCDLITCAFIYCLCCIVNGVLFGWYGVMVFIIPTLSFVMAYLVRVIIIACKK